MKKLFFSLSVFMVCCCCFSKQIEKFAVKNINNNPREAFFYVKQVEKFYPLLWKGKAKSLKGDNIEEFWKDQDAIVNFKINQIKAGGALEKRWKIATQQGFFNLMEEAFKAPLKNVVDLGNETAKNDSPSQKVIATLLVSRYIYYLQILRLAEKNRWEEVIHNLAVWENAVSVVRPNELFKNNIMRIINHILATYKIPEPQKDIVLKLKKKLEKQVPVAEKQ